MGHEDHAVPMARALLSYDGLPPGSRLTRQWHGGGVRIVAPGGPPADSALAAARARSLVEAAALAALLLGFFVLMSALVAAHNATRPSAWVVLPFTLLAASVLGLIYFARQGARAEALAGAYRRVALLEVRDGRLRVEAAGDGPPQSYDWPARQVEALRVAPEGRPRRGPGAWRPRGDPAALVVVLADGQQARLLAGRSGAELAWVAATLRRALAGQGAAALEGDA